MAHSSSSTEKMNSFSLLVLGLAALLPPGLAVDVNNLNDIVSFLLNKYEPTFPRSNVAPTFTLAVAVPPGSVIGQNGARQIHDDPQTVKNMILWGCDIYRSASMVAATVLKLVDAHKCHTNSPIIGHSEFRVLKMFNLKPSDQELMVFYCSSSPCNRICTNKNNRYNILQSIKVINGWTNRALVFNKIFHPPNRGPLTPTEMTTSLKNLATSIGNNIYRCSDGQCRRCLTDNVVEGFCISDSVRERKEKNKNRFKSEM